MEVINEERDYINAPQCAKQPEGTKEDEIKLEDITTDIENIQVECKKVNCSPVINTFRAIYKLFCHLMKCFKFKKE